MWTLSFWRDAAERALRTAAQSALATLGVDGLGLLNVDWGGTASVAGLAALASVLTSVVASRTGDPDSASFGRSERYPS